MIRWCPSHPSVRVPSGARCPACSREREQRRGDRYERGYGREHQAARRLIAASLPSPCLYCSGVIAFGERFDAAHVVDGQPDAGWAASHPACNQRAKKRQASAWA